MVKFVHPAQLEDLMGVDIGKEPATEDALKEICEKVFLSAASLNYC